MIDPTLIFKLLLLIGAANGAPILARILMGERLNRPVDAGRVLSDEQPLFGKSKTLRGIVAALAASSLGAPLLGIDWYNGLFIGMAAMVGDLVSSFTKRRLKLAPSSRATGLDQIPEALLPALAAVWLLDLGWLDVPLLVALFMLGSIVLSKWLYRLNIRRRPY